MRWETALLVIWPPLVASFGLALGFLVVALAEEMSDRLRRVLRRSARAVELAVSALWVWVTMSHFPSLYLLPLWIN